MKSQRQSLLSVFSICFILSLLLFILWQKGLLHGASTGIGQIVAPMQQHLVAIVQQSRPSILTIDKLQEENDRLRVLLAQKQMVEQENQALRDQFQTTTPASMNLTPAEIVGIPNFFPGVTNIEEFVINKGEQDKIRLGEAVVAKDMLIGKITDVTDHFSKVTLISNPKISFAAKTTGTQALGVVKGIGSGQFIFDNVVLSDSLKLRDIVITSGDVGVNGIGLPQGLIVGKIISVDKNPSALFQKASLQMMIDVTKLTMVFVVSL